jgi:hypothetical protein
VGDVADRLLAVVLPEQRQRQLELGTVGMTMSSIRSGVGVDAIPVTTRCSSSNDLISSRL